MARNDFPEQRELFKAHRRFTTADEMFYGSAHFDDSYPCSILRRPTRRCRRYRNAT
ncbi:hypothetical protein ACX9NE_22155 [Mycobacterium sp. ML4]